MSACWGFSFRVPGPGPPFMPARVLASGPQPLDPHSQGSLGLLCHFAVPIAYVDAVPGPWPASWQHPSPCELAGAVCVSRWEPPRTCTSLSRHQVHSHPIPYSQDSQDFLRAWPGLGPGPPVALCCGFIYPTNYILATEVRSKQVCISGSSHASLVRPALAHMLLREFYIKITCLYHVGDCFLFFFSS